jgi:hypothetical protein
VNSVLGFSAGVQHRGGSFAEPSKSGEQGVVTATVIALVFYAAIQGLSDDICAAAKWFFLTLS